MRRAGHFVDVFEQDRMIGGRVATARIGAEAYDHGAQYIATRTSSFRDYLDEIVDLGLAAHWAPRRSLNGGEGAGRLASWIVGTPGMASIMRPLADSVRVHTGRRVHTLERRSAGWHVWFDDETSTGPFQAIAAAVPAAQARTLLGRIDEFDEPMSRVRMAPCWSLMVRLDDATLPQQDVYSDVSDVIRWIARNNAKPRRRSAGDSLVIHASSAWSRDMEHAEPEAVAEELWDEVSHLLGLPPVRPARLTAHLWRHGIVERALGEPCLYSSEHRAGAAGDWCLGRLAEHAYESGEQLGKAIVESLN